MVLEERVVSYFVEAVLENPDRRLSEQDRNEYRGWTDDCVIGYRFWILIHNVDLNKLQERPREERQRTRSEVTPGVPRAQSEGSVDPLSAILGIIADGAPKGKRRRSRNAQKNSGRYGSDDDEDDDAFLPDDEDEDDDDLSDVIRTGKGDDD